MPRELTRSGKTFDGEPKVARQSNRAPLVAEPCSQSGMEGGEAGCFYGFGLALRSMFR
jgi:hypothetical protein